MSSIIFPLKAYMCLWNSCTTVMFELAIDNLAAQVLRDNRVLQLSDVVEKLSIHILDNNASIHKGPGAALHTALYPGRQPDRECVLCRETPLPQKLYSLHQELMSPSN
jgi:hypothetical protein